MLSQISVLLGRAKVVSVFYGLFFFDWLWCCVCGFFFRDFWVADNDGSQVFFLFFSGVLFWWLSV